MSEIKKLIERLCPDGVEYKRIDSLFETFSGMTGVSDKWKETGNCQFIDYLNVYNNMRVDVKNLPFATVKNPQQNTLQKGDILLTCASETPDECAMSSVIRDDINEGIFLDDHLFAIRLKSEHKNIVNTAFLNYYMHSSAFRIQVCKKVRGVTRFYITGKPFMSLEIPVPPIEVQSKIVEILDNFTELESELESELEARRKQYEYYRNQLLTFDKVGGARFDVKWMKLGDVCDIKGRIGFRGYTIKDQVEKSEGALTLTASNIVKQHIDYNKNTYITWEKYYESPEIMVKNGDIIVCQRGSIGKIAIVEHLNEEATINPQLLLLKNINCNNKYLTYYLTSCHFQKALSKIVGHGTVQMIAQKDLKNLLIPIIPEQEQQRIVSILDRFEALTTDLQSGLPAEIEARRKQYEYYREQLLTFKRKTA